MDQIIIEEKAKKNKRLLKSKYSKIAVVAALMIVLAFAIPFFKGGKSFLTSSANAAESILDKSIEMFESIKTMYIKFKVRTIEDENFDCIDLNEELITQELWVNFSNNHWKLKKKGREACSDSKNNFLYFTGTTYAIKGQEDFNYAGWISILFNPKKILEKEKEFAKNEKVKLSNSEKDDITELIVKQQAFGDFTAGYLKNSSILESNNKRIYNFDKNNLLKSLKIIIDDKTVVLETIDIKYNQNDFPKDLSIELPSNVDWFYDKEEIFNEEFINISSEEAAKLFFNKLSKKQWNTLKGAFDDFEILKGEELNSLKKTVSDLEIISIGKSFKSGMYPGEFVPYKIKLNDGNILENNLALRNDNPMKVWVVDGGF